MWNKRHIHLLINKIERNPNKSTPTLAVKMATETNKMVHAKNVRRILRRNRYTITEERPEKKTLISLVNRQKRVNYALK